jgi:hypothetical protein
MILMVDIWLDICMGCHTAIGCACNAMSAANHSPVFLNLSHPLALAHQVVGKDWHELKHKLHTEAEALAASNQQGGGEGNDNSMEATPAPGEAIAGGSSGNGNGNNDGRGRAAGPSTSAAVPVKAEPAGTSTGAQAAAAALAAAVDGAERGEGTLCPICLDEPEVCGLKAYHSTSTAA